MSDCFKHGWKHERAFCPTCFTDTKYQDAKMPYPKHKAPRNAPSIAYIALGVFVALITLYITKLVIK